MLGALAAVALIVGSISATLSVTQDGHQAIEHAREPVAEIQATESVDTSAAEDRGV